MQSSNLDKKRKALTDIINIYNNDGVNDEDRQRWAKFDESHWFPIQPVTNVAEVPKLPDNFKVQMYILI